MKKSALLVLFLALVAGFFLTVGRYEYVHQNGYALRVDRLTGRTYVLRKVGYSGAVEWVAFRSAAEVKQATPH